MKVQENTNSRSLGFFERYLTIWVILCIGIGILLGKNLPGLARTLDGIAIQVNGAPVISIPIAVCLFFMMYPIMVKIDFNSIIKAGKSGKPVLLTLFINWCVKPFTMYATATLLFGLSSGAALATVVGVLIEVPVMLGLVGICRRTTGWFSPEKK